MPDRFNRYRNIMYDVIEAYKILRNAEIVKDWLLKIKEIITASSVFTKKGRSSLFMASEKLAESNEIIVAIYTCGIYIFVIGCRSGRFFVVDTYTITPEFGGNGDGLLKVFSGKDLPSQRDVWGWKRLALSGVKWNAVQSFLIMEEYHRWQITP